MNIFGERIFLRAIEKEDCEMLLELINDPETEMMLGGSSWPVSHEAQIKWQEQQIGNNDILRCVICHKNNLKSLGTIMLSDINYKNGTAEIHIKMKKDGGRGKGYGTEAIAAMIKYAFDELRLNCIYANVLSYNNISKRLFEKCGFKQEGLLKSRVFKAGKFVDVYSYSIINNS